MVYKDKYDLICTAGLIYNHIGITNPESVNLKTLKEGNSYTGCGTILSNLNIPLIGLEEGIRRTIEQLKIL